MRLNKVILSVISYIVVGSFQIVVWGQTISGKIIDSEQRPIEGATIVLQTVDSIYIDASISNADGIFTLNGQQEKYASGCCRKHSDTIINRCYRIADFRKTRQQRVGAGIQPGKGRPGKPVHRLRQAVR